MHSVWTEEQREISRKTMREMNHELASERMKRNNPSKNPEVRQKISRSLKAMNHRPSIQGGNGRGLTVPQMLLVQRLSDFHPSTEFVIPTGKRSQGYSTHYKIDIAFPLQKVAIEVDGSSHYALKVQTADIKKTEFLNGLGWKVLRFSNQSVINDLETCVRTVVSTISP